MSITRELKTPRGYGVTGYDLFEEIAPGDRPPLGDAGYVAPWLPVLQQEQMSNEWLVLLAGRIVGMDRTLTDKDERGNSWDTQQYSGGYAPRIVPCNSSGSTQTITYSANDVGKTVDVDDQTSLVSAAADATAVLPANKPIGWMMHNVYSGSIPYTYINYEKQTRITILCDYYVEVALIGLDGQDSLAPGDLVKPYTQGNLDVSESALYQGCPTFWNSASDSIEQVAGRVTVVSEIPYGTKSRARADLTRPVRGLSLPGVDTTGKVGWLSMAQATKYARINIGLL